jgi:hypothetical protein
MNRIRILIIIIFGILFFALFSESVIFANDNINLDKTIAIVNDIPIKYRDIHVSMDIIKTNPMLADLDGNELENQLLEIEQQRLLYRIKEIIIDNAINIYKISVTKEEIDEEYNSILGLLNMEEEDLQGIKDKMICIVEALELWQKNPEHEKKIYKDKLSSVISYEEWEEYMNFYNTPAKIEEIKKHIPTFSEDIEKYTKQGIIEQIKLSKLKNAVGINVKVTDNEVEKFYDQRYPEIVSWDAYHFYSLDRPMLVNVRESFMDGDEIEEIIQDYNLSNSPKGGISREVYYPEIVPFYAQGIYNLSSGDVSSIIEGPFYLGWPGAEIPERFKDKENYIFYHFIFLIDANRKESKPEYNTVKDVIKNELLNLKKEEVWSEWLRKQVIESDIIIIDQRYNNILK